MQNPLRFAGNSTTRSAPRGRFSQIEKHKTMHDNQRSDRRSRSGSRQRSHRGGRRETSRPSGQQSSHSSSQNRPQAPAKKPSFWQKLVSFFTGGQKSTNPSRAGQTPSARQDRQPSQNGHRRFESTAPASAPRQARKPELVEVSSPKLYVGNLSFDATETDLEELFNGVGQVQVAEVVSNKYTQKSKGFAFVSMLTVDEARRAVTELHDKEFMGRKLVVSGAKTNDRESAPRQIEAHSESAPAEPSAL